MTAMRANQNLIRGLEAAFAGVLPLSRVLLGIGKFVDICNDMAKGGGDYVVRQINWLCER
jgi:hypothetical protein